MRLEGYYLHGFTDGLRAFYAFKWMGQIRPKPLSLTFFVYPGRPKRAVESLQPWPVCPRHSVKTSDLCQPMIGFGASFFKRSYSNSYSPILESTAADARGSNLPRKKLSLQTALVPGRFSVLVFQEIRACAMT